MGAEQATATKAALALTERPERAPPEGFNSRAAGFTLVDPYRGNMALQD
jgi:hypothetical protein